MSESLLVPYQVLQGNDWSVDAVLYSLYSKSIIRTPLTEIAQINLNRMHTKDIDSSQQYCYIELSSISAETGFIDKPQYLLGEFIPTRGKLLAKKGDILLSTARPERGLIAIVPRELDNCIVSNAFLVLTPKDISSELLWLVLRSEKVIGELKLMASGTTIPTLKISKLREYGLPFKWNYEWDEKAQKLYIDLEKAYLGKSSLPEIVDKVFTCELLESEEKKVEPSDFFLVPYEQLSSDRMDVNYYYQGLFQPTFLWRVPFVPLENLINPISPIGEPKTKFLQVRVQDLEEEEVYINIERVKRQTNEPKTVTSNFIPLCTGHLLLGRISLSGIKKCALVPLELEGAIAATNILVFSIVDGLIPEYVAYYFKSKWAEMQYKMLGLPTITITSSDIKSVKIPLPTLEEQQSIVQKIQQELEEHDFRRLAEEMFQFQKEIFTRS
ncbi:restriction endonuclease subunit S [Priestia megaterium]|uniref:restriction endonuclease subunit S n=1 Tax=Priestia megaterium TaxID=1404 RepID=UPI002E1EFAA4|nr:restriction endonuclease subunit S [Priestia megaterium]MED4051542.1 restriction endonuclease subunit S [Priestia megaterium]